MTPACVTESTCGTPWSDAKIGDMKAPPAPVRHFTAPVDASKAVRAS